MNQTKDNKMSQGYVQLLDGHNIAVSELPKRPRPTVNRCVEDFNPHNQNIIRCAPSSSDIWHNICSQPGIFLENVVESGRHTKALLKFYCPYNGDESKVEEMTQS